MTSIVKLFSGLTVALFSLFLCQHWLDKTPQITNPIKHIVKVLNCTRKNKYSRNHSALTYWEQDVPSQLDLDKNNSGPFSEEEVEDLQIPNITFMFNDNIEVVMSLIYYWTMIPQVFGGFGIVLCTIASFEFIIAQSLITDKLIGYNLFPTFLLLSQSILISCGFYYYLIQTLCVHYLSHSV